MCAVLVGIGSKSGSVDIMDRDGLANPFLLLEVLPLVLIFLTANTDTLWDSYVQKLNV